MKGNRRMWRSLILISTIMLGFIFTLQGREAKNNSNLLVYNSSLQNVKLYHSYKYSTLVLAVENKGKERFACQPNSYIIYNYQKNSLLYYKLASLILNDTFDKAFVLNIKQVKPYQPEELNKVRQELLSFMKELEISSGTLKNASSLSRKDGSICWIRGGILDVAKDEIENLPFLGSNFCKDAWCPDAYWKSYNKIKFWTRLHPKKAQLVEYNADTEEYKIISDQEKHPGKAPGKIDNVPRKNLMTPKRFKQGNFVVSKSKNIVLKWDKIYKNSYLFYISNEDGKTNIGNAFLKLSQN